MSEFSEAFVTHATPKVAFIGPGGTFEVRLMANTSTDICEAATTLKASHFVAREGEGWGVFEMRTAQKNNPVPGVWSINDPIKVFPLDAQDAAIVYATMRAERK